MTFSLTTSFLDQLPLGLILVDIKGRVQWANRWVQDRLAVPLTPGVPLDRIVVPEARQLLHRELESVFTTHRPTFLSHRFRPQVLQLLPPSQPGLEYTPHQIYLLYVDEPKGEPWVALVVENLTARQMAETRLQRQLRRQRTLYHAVSPLSRPDPEAPKRSLQALVNLLKPDHLALYLLEEGRSEAQLSVSLGTSHRPLPAVPPAQSLVAWALREQRLVRWWAGASDPLTENLHPLDPASQVAVVIPLGTDGVLGVMALENRRNEPLDENDVGLLQSVAEHIGVNIQWQRSYERERRLRRLANTLRETGLQLTTTLDSDRIQDLILRFVGEVVPYDSASILILHDQRVTVSRYRGYARFGVSDAVLRNLELNLQEVANLKRMAQAHQPLVIPDTRKDPNWVHLPTSGHIKSWVGAPIITRERLVGFLTLDHTQPGFYNAEHAQVLAIFASQAALALENAWLYERRYQEAITDPLTGLANRRYFQSQFEREVTRAQRFQRPLSLLMIDLDDFKRHNDTFGHPAGDEALKLIARTLERNTRRVDLVARYGGEEFVVVLPETPSDKALKVAQRIVQAVRRLYQEPGSPLRAPLTISVGIATMPDHATSMEDLILAADVALYYAKRQGKDRAVVYSPDFSACLPYHSAFD